MRTLFTLLIIIVLLPGKVFAQQGMTPEVPADALSRLNFYAGQGDSFSIYNDSLIEANYYKLYNKNRYTKGVPGFRIRIFSDSGLGAKEEGQKVRARFHSLYPDIYIEPKYDQPDFKVYVGNCRTRSEAIKLYERIKANYSNALIVPVMIYVDGLD